MSSSVFDRLYRTETVSSRQKKSLGRSSGPFATTLRSPHRPRTPSSNSKTTTNRSSTSRLYKTETVSSIQKKQRSEHVAPSPHRTPRNHGATPRTNTSRKLAPVRTPVWTPVRTPVRTSVRTPVRIPVRTPVSSTTTSGRKKSTAKPKSMTTTTSAAAAAKVPPATTTPNTAADNNPSPAAPPVVVDDATTTTMTTTVVLWSTKKDPTSFALLPSLAGISTSLADYELGILPARDLAVCVVTVLFHRDFTGGASKWDIDSATAKQVVLDVDDESGGNEKAFDVIKEASYNHKDIYSVASSKARIHFDDGNHDDDDDDDAAATIRIEGYSYYVAG